MSSSETRYSTSVSDRGSTRHSANVFRPAEISVDPSQYFDAWLRQLERPIVPHTPEPQKVASGESPLANNEFTFDGTLRIDCRVKGRIRSANGALIIAEKAKAESDIDVGVAIIKGEVRGNINAGERVEIASSGTVIGDIRATVISIEPGAVFEGRCFFLPAPEPAGVLNSGNDSADRQTHPRPQFLADAKDEEHLFVAVG